jgi:hypothetical protein
MFEAYLEQQPDPEKGRTRDLSRATWDHILALEPLRNTLDLTTMKWEDLSILRTTQQTVVYGLNQLIENIDRLWVDARNSASEIERPIRTGQVQRMIDMSKLALRAVDMLEASTSFSRNRGTAIEKS